MNENRHHEILELLRIYLEKNPKQRFGQALFNLRVNEFANSENPEKENYQLRDIYGDKDEDILERIRKQIENIS